VCYMQHRSNCQRFNGSWAASAVESTEVAPSIEGTELKVVIVTNLIAVLFTFLGCSSSFATSYVSAWLCDQERV